MKPTWRVAKIPILKDNFVFVIHDTRRAFVIDPGIGAPVVAFLQENQLHCEKILLTHHHEDHIGGVAEILAEFPCEVWAPLANKKQIAFATHFVTEREGFIFDGLEVHIWEVPGHTLGHIAYWLPLQKWLFSGDVIFALGCGRLFEGSFEQMFNTLQKIKGLPDEVLVFCTHDYYATNRRFADQEGFSLEEYESIHPLLLGQEKQFNPFLTAKDVATFRERREKRNHF